MVDLDTAKTLTPAKDGPVMSVTLDVPIVDDKQSAHLKVTGTLTNAGYRLVNNELIFERTLHGLRNTILLPAGWDVSAVSQSGTVGAYQGRAFVSLINLNSENNYKVSIRARAISRPLKTGLNLNFKVKPNLAKSVDVPQFEVRSSEFRGSFATG